jgi:hypothetical protein
MNNTTIDDVNPVLHSMPYQLNIWLGLILWFTGNIGCVGNIIVFRSQSFRHRAYSIYLFWAAMCDIYYFNYVLLTRILAKGFGISLMNYFTTMCKVREFSSIWGNVVSFSLFTLATVDRLLSAQRSTGKLRSMSSNGPDISL